MKIKQLIYLSLFLFASCKTDSRQESSFNSDSNVAVANKFINAFYSFNSDTLTSILSGAPESSPDILYYQQWAACGNYEVMKRNNFIERNDTLVLCPITVKDDLMGALKIDFNVTDTFHITILNGQIRSVKTSSNDPDLYYQAREWVKENQPELIEKPCAGIDVEGSSPCECIKGIVKGFGEFIASEKQAELK